MGTRLVLPAIPKLLAVSKEPKLGEVNYTSLIGRKSRNSQTYVIAP